MAKVEAQMATLVAENKESAEDLAQLKKNYEDLSEALRKILAEKKQ